jgi:DNA topoisomerase-1
MAKSLVIVESPAKAKTINKYLGRDYKVLASMGHVRDLPKSKLGVDVDEGFAPVYELLATRKKVIAELKSAAKDATDIYIATDPDREGEAIGWHLAEELGTKKKKIHRLMFNEITKKAVQEAMKHPGSIDMKMVDAQQARRVLDRLVGYKISPILWDKVRRGSATRAVGRAQADLRSRAGDSEVRRRMRSSPPRAGAARFRSEAGRGDETLKIGNEEQSKDVLRNLEVRPTSSVGCDQGAQAEPRRRSSPASAVTARYPVKRTMQIAQQL